MIRISSLQKISSVSYSAIILDEKSKQKLYQIAKKYKKPGSKRFLDHLTLTLGPLKDPEMEGKPAKIVIEAIGVSEDAVAFKAREQLRIDGATANWRSLKRKGKSKFPHITAFTFGGARPRISGRIEDFKELDRPIIVEGIVKQVGWSNKQANVKADQLIPGWRSKIPLYVKEALQICKSNGKPAYIVGGAVRDLFLGKTPNDFDLVSNIPFEPLKESFLDAGWDADETGKTFGVLRVLKDGDHSKEVEIARFRKDLHPGDNKTVVAPGNMSDDAHRRDFTFNALYLDPLKGVILDPTGEGLRDLRRREVHFIGDPDQRMKEDYSRLFRFFKFLRKLEFRPGEADFAAVKRNIKNLRETDPNKITTEIEAVLELKEFLKSVGDELYNNEKRRVSLKVPENISRKQKKEFLLNNPEMLLQLYKDFGKLKSRGFLIDKKDLAFVRDHIHLIGANKGKQYVDRITNMIASIYGVEHILKDLGIN